MTDEIKDNKLFYTVGLDKISNFSLPDNCSVKHNSSEYRRSVAATTIVNDRSGFNRYDYYEGRTEEKLPTNFSDIIIACQGIYKKVGIVRTVMDLMTDFASEGLNLKHPIRSQERFYRKWANKVDLQGRVHDFIKLLLRDANVIVRRKSALISRPIIKDMSKGYVELPDKLKIEKRKSLVKMEIPWKYTFISPAIVNKLGGPIGRFWGADAIGIKIPITLASAIASPKNDVERSLINKLPGEIIEAVKNGSRIVALDMSKIYIDYYKKDDWEDWGTPFLYSVLEDVLFREKMRLADMATLDGVINVIRLWKLGDSEHQILPTQAAVDKLRDILQNNTGGGAMDLIWNDMIELQTEYPPTERILGSDKYKSVNSDIFKGLGIPESLVGSDSGARNSQSAFIQLKTLIERLEYVRGRAIKWINTELRLLADAVGFRNIPVISFGTMSLRDEAAEKQLMVQLLDRGIVSAERIHEVFGSDFLIELERLRDEQEIRKIGDGVLERAGPYYRPNSVMEKQTELQIDLEEAKVGLGGGDNLGGDQPTDDGDNQVGRPPNTLDTSPRDNRTPKTFSDIVDNINKYIIPKYLKKCGVNSPSNLTTEQINNLRHVQIGIIASIDHDHEIDIRNIELNQDKFRNFKQLLNKKYPDYKLVDTNAFSQMLIATFMEINKLERGE